MSPKRTTMNLTVAIAAVALVAPAAAGAAPAEPVASGGFGWLDLAVGAGVLGGILLLGLYGDRVLGAVIVALVEIPVAGARAIAGLAGRPRGGRAASRTVRPVPQPPARSKTSAAR
jgi:hypothetical protein